MLGGRQCPLAARVVVVLVVCASVVGRRLAKFKGAEVRRQAGESRPSRWPAPRRGQWLPRLV